MLFYAGRVGERMKLQIMTRCALLTAVMAVCAWLAVPMGDVAVTLQTFGLFLTLSLLGGKFGTLVCLLYLLLGAVGLPVFAGFQGGLGVLLGPTGGYLWGFLAASLIYWLLERHLPRYLCLAIGMAACYLCGTAWYYFVWSDGGLWLILLKCVLPYLLPDAGKLLLAWICARRLERFA